MGDTFMDRFLVFPPPTAVLQMVLSPPGAAFQGYLWAAVGDRKFCSAKVPSSNRKFSLRPVKG